MRNPDVWMRKIEDLAWWIFLGWSVVCAAVMPFEIGEATLAGWIGNPGLRDALLYLLSIVDALWFVLAATVAYLFVLSDVGRTGRVWTWILVAGSALIMGVGAKTGVPFGAFVYTDNMGSRLFGTLPFTVPLAWMVILLGARYAVLHFYPRAGRLQIATGSALIALATDLNLEFVAWKVRAYWIWYPPGSPLAFDAPSWPPLQNYLSWFVIAFALVAVLPSVTIAPRRNPMRLIGLLFVLNGVFLLTHIVRWIRFGGYY